VAADLPVQGDVENQAVDVDVRPGVWVCPSCRRYSRHRYRSCPLVPCGSAWFREVDRIGVPACVEVSGKGIHVRKGHIVEDQDQCGVADDEPSEVYSSGVRGCLDDDAIYCLPGLITDGRVL